MPLKEHLKAIDLIEPVTPEVPEQEAEKPVSKLAGHLQAIDEPETSGAATAVDNTAGLDGDREGKVYDLSKKSGYDAPTVREFFEDVESSVNRTKFTIKDDKDNNIGTYLEGSLLDGQPNAAVSGDDIDGLNRVQSKWQRLKSGAKTGYETGDIETKINNLTAQRELLGGDPNIINPQIDELIKQAEEIPEYEPRHLLEKVVTSTARQLPQQISGIKRGIERAPLGMLIAGGATLVLGQVPPFTVLPEEAVVLPTISGGAVTAFVAGRGEQMFYQEFGGAYREYLDIRDTQGQPIDKGVAKVMAIGAGGINSILENASFLTMIKAFKGGDKVLGQLTPDFIRKIAKSKTVRAQLASIAARYGIAWTAEETTEILQETSTVLMGEAAKVLESQSTGTEFEDFDWLAFRDRMENIAEETAYSTIGFLFPGAAVSTGKVLADSQVSKNFHDDMDSLKADVEVTKTQARSTDHTREALEKMGVNHEVYVAPSFWDFFYQERKPKEGEVELTDAEIQEDRQALLDHLGVSHEQVSESITTGNDIAVKANDILSLKAEHYQGIQDDIKPAPGAYTRRELNEQVDVDDIDHTVELLKQRAEARAEVTAGINEEITRISNEIRKAKLPDEKLAIDAPVLLRGIARRAELEGVDPVQKLKDLTIKRTPLADFLARGKEFFAQAPTETDFELSQDIATLSARIDKLDPADPTSKKLISKLEKERAKVEKRLQDRAFANYETFFQSAFHGTPFRFDEFSLEHLGKGEGAQAFGWGLYFAEKKDIADWYRENLRRKAHKGADTLFKGQNTRDLKNRRLRIRLNDIAFQLETFPHRGFEAAKNAKISDLNELIAEEKTLLKEDESRPDKWLTELNEAKSVIESSARADFKREGGTPKGATLKVELPGDEQILNWEKPLSEQSEAVKKAAREFVEPPEPITREEIDNIIQEINNTDIDEFFIEGIERDIASINGFINKITVDGELDTDIVSSSEFNTGQQNIFRLQGTLRDIGHEDLGSKVSSINNSLTAMKFPLDFQVRIEEETGKDLYQRLVEEFGSDKAASQWLSERGIKGHKFWDGSSRNRAGAKTFNFVIYDDEVIDIVETFFQAKEGKKFLGALTFDPRRTKAGALINEQRMIELFEGADLSTLLHEIGHFAILEYTEIERSGQASDSLKADMNTIREFVGAEEGAALTREQTETVARAWEAWILEGKAPSSKLKAVFVRLMNMLKSVYQTAKELDVTLNDEIRGVFDRMIAQGNEVEAAASNSFTVKSDAEMSELGVIPDDKRYAKELIKSAVDEAKIKLHQARNANWKQKNKQWEKEARNEIRAEVPAYDIINDIILNGDQINRADMIEMIPLPVKVPAGKSIITLSDSRRRSLETIKSEIEQGEAATRTIVRDKEGNIVLDEKGETKVIVSGGTLPDYFTGKNYTKDRALPAINKALAGKPLTEIQRITVDDLLSSFREQAARLITAERAERAESFEFGALADPEIEEAPRVQTQAELEKLALELLPEPKLVKKNGKNIDEIAMQYFDTDAQTMIDNLIQLPKFKEAVQERVTQKQREHDAQFNVEDFIVDSADYRKYLELMGRYVLGKGLDQATIDAGIQRNIKRWEKEADSEIRSENPELSGRDLQIAVDDRVQEKIASFQEKKARVGAISTDALKALAKEVIAAKTVRDARAQHRYMAASKKAAGEGRRAIAKKDWAAASAASEVERFNYEMASLSGKVREEVDDILARVKRIGKPKAKGKDTIEYDFREGMLHLIERFQLAPYLPRSPEQTPDYAELFAGDVYGKSFEKPAFFDGSGDYRDLRMEQLRELDRGIRYLAGEGKIGKDEFMADGETRFEDVNEEAVSIHETMNVLKKWEKGSMMRRITDWTRSAFSRLDSLTFIAKSSDGYTNLGKDGKKGPMERYVIDPIKDAIDKLLKDQKRINAELAPHLDQIQKTNRKWRKMFKKNGGHIVIDGVPLPSALRADGQTKGWRDYQLWAIVLNTGNTGDKSNLQNLIAGFQDELTPQMIEKVKDMFTVEDMEAVQGIWDTINSLYSQTNAQFFKDNNYYLPKVEATPFHFKGRDFKGGYYPIKHDRNLSYKVADRGLVEDFFNNEGAKIVVPFTPKGHTVTRKDGVALPLKLELNVIDSHFRETLQYIHFSDPVRDSDRITRNPEFRETFIDVLGEAVYGTIRPSLQHIASPKMEGLDLPTARGWEWLRGLSTAYILAWNTGVALKQPLSTFGAIRDLGGGDAVKGTQVYLRGIMEVITSPRAHHQMMIDLSDYMNNRQSAFDRELHSEFIKLSAAQKGIYFNLTKDQVKKITWQDVKNFGFWQIRIADATTVLPIWHGAFQDKLAADQSNLEEAVRYADDMVRNSQPSAQPLDLSSWQRDAGAIRLFSQFQTFTVGKYGQRQRMFYRAWRNKSITTAEYAWFNFFDAFLPMVSINLLQAVLWGKDLEDEDTQIEMLVDSLVGSLTMGIPIVSNIARTYTSGYGEYLDSPVLQTGSRMIEGLLAGLESLNGFENDKDRERALWDIAHVLSILMGVPVDKIVARAIKGSKQKKGVEGAKYLVPAPIKR
jgi:hypothetical protein